MMKNIILKFKNRLLAKGESQYIELFFNNGENFVLLLILLLILLLGEYMDTPLFDIILKMIGMSIGFKSSSIITTLRVGCRNNKIKLFKLTKKILIIFSVILILIIIVHFFGILELKIEYGKDSNL